MSLISTRFLLFVCIAAAGYYLIPKKFQWLWLLIFSYIYYASSSVKILFFLLFTTGTTYLAGLWLDQINTTQTDKKAGKIKKRKVLILTLFLNFGMLAVLKYTNFAIENINTIVGSRLTFQNLILPLGISFYTFQSMGYLIDVYWGKYKPERNPLD